MARIATVSAESVPVALKEIVEQIKQQYGTLPGVYQVFLADPNVGGRRPGLSLPEPSPGLAFHKSPT